MNRSRASDGLLLGLIGLVAATFVRSDLWRDAVLQAGVPSPDVYQAQYPMLVYAWRSLWRGHGLLWNSVGPGHLTLSTMGLDRLRVVTRIAERRLTLAGSRRAPQTQFRGQDHEPQLAPSP